MFAKIRWLAPLALALCLAGCGAAQTTAYVRPAVKMPTAWQGGHVVTTGAENADAPEKARTAEDAVSEEEVRALSAGALGFHDPNLERLLAEALRRNNDLAAAAIKVRQARLEAGLAADAMWPTLGADFSGNYSRDLDDNTSDKSHAASGTLSWEVDLWGKLSKQRDMSQWEAQATDQDRRSAAISLVCTTAELYFQIGYLNQSLELGRRGIARAEKSLELARLRYASGADSSLEVQEAMRSLATLQANQEDLARQLSEARTAMAVLFDGPPRGVDCNPASLPVMATPSVEEGLPAEILGRRPDLRAAEIRLRSSLTNVDVQRVNYYPTLSLTGTLGSTSSALMEVINHPVASLLASVSLPFLQWNEMKLNTELAQAQYDQAVVEFRQTLYEALKEVDDALSARQYYARQGARLEQALDAATKVEGMYEVRYRSGAESMQVWLDAQDNRQTAESSLLSNRLNRLVNYLVLYQALGGEPVKAPAKS